MKSLARATIIPLFILALTACQADLQVQLAATASTNYAPGADIAGTVSLEVENTGNASAQGTDSDGGYMVDLVLSQDTSVPVTFATVPSPYDFQEDMLLEGGRISNTVSLQGGAAHSYGGRVMGIIPPGTPSPVHLCAVVDPDNVVAESNEDNNTDCIDIGAHAGHCVTFETQAVGTQYGNPAGHSPGSRIFTENGIAVRVADFHFVGTGGTFNSARIESSTPTFGVGNRFLFINNLNLELDFGGLPFTPSRVTFQFRDLGGSENLSINNLPTPIYAGELTAAPSPIGGVDVTTAPRAPVSGGYKSDATLSGRVQVMRVGGQEFAIDQICAFEGN